MFDELLRLRTRRDDSATTFDGERVTLVARTFREVPRVRSGQTCVVSDLAYLTRLHRNPSPLLLELEQSGYAERVPAVARATGRFLSTIVHAMQANRILEIGTSFGYATMWMALAMPPAGRLWTIDPDIERTTVARGFLERAGRGDAVEIVNQPALDVLPTFPIRNLDVVFIDADRAEYARYLDLAIPMLKRSGLVIVDDLLRGGRAAMEPASDDDDDTRAIRAFNRAFLAHPDLDATIVPMGDGLGIGIGALVA